MTGWDKLLFTDESIPFQSMEFQSTDIRLVTSDSSLIKRNEREGV
jgi:hypothetical protein